MKHAVIIRLHYEPESPYWPWRRAFFEATVLPRLLAQTDRDFDIWVRCHRAHREIVQAMHPKIRTHCTDTPFFTATHEWEPNEDGTLGQPPATPELPYYAIQTRLDSDDWVEPGYIARVKKEVRRHAAGGPLVVSFQPWKFDLWSLKKYRIGKDRYHEKSPSQFLSLYQPDTENWRDVCAFNHRRIWRHFPQVVMVPEGYCYLMVHGQNAGMPLAHKSIAYTIRREDKALD
jgi:hypothetical protein